MFKKKTIQVTKKTKIYRSKETRYPWLGTTLNILLPYALLFLITGGCAMIYGSVFPIEGSIPAAFLCIGIVEAALFPLYLVPVIKKYAQFLSAGVFLIIFLIFRDSVFSGLQQCANEFLLLFYNYYGVDLSVLKETPNTAGNWAAVCFVTLLVLWFLIEAFFYRKKMLLLFLPPLFFICMELFVGMAPAELPVAMVSVGCFGLLPYGNGSYRNHRGTASCIRGKSALFLTAAIVLCFFTVNLVGREKAEFLASLQAKGLIFQGALEQQFTEYAATVFSRGDSCRISNIAPQYEEKVVLSLTTDLLPQENLYLRGYVGDTYRNGNWTNESHKRFASAMSNLSKADQSLSGSYILNLLYQTQAGSLGLGAARANYEIRYLDLPDDYAYLPYMANLSDIQNADKARLSLPSDADATLYRAGEDRLFAYAAVPYRLLYDAKKGAFYQKNEAIENSYENYLSQYLRVPDHLDRLNELGAQLSETFAKTAANQENIYSLSETREILAAFLVCKELAARRSYSLSLDSVPFGTDIVEYFLFDSGKGFCEHYASAGVLLLRKMGIPARYVTGYVIRPSDFTQVSSTEYTALVKDSAAHAWTEIYIKNVGWVPVEMTSGSISETSAYAPLFADSAIREPAADSAPDIQQTNTASDSADHTALLPEADNTREKGSTTGTGRHAGFHQILLWLVCIGLLTGIFSILSSVYRERRRAASFAQKDCRKAVQSIASYTNRLLWKKNIIKRRDLDDRAYRETVKNGLPTISEEDLDAYFSVLERAAYSNELMTETDKACCYNIYTKIKCLK